MSNLLSSSLINKEIETEISLRPEKLNDYVGQEELTRNLKIYIGAALSRNETIDHTLFYGPPGLGKTTLAYIIANEMNSKIHVINGPSIEKLGDIASILIELNPGDILFIDEIHRIPKFIEESLYTAMEDYVFTLNANQGNGSKIIKIELPPFTLIGATTQPGNLSLPLRARFGIVLKLDYYSIKDLMNIILRTSKVFNCPIEEKCAYEIAKRSRGTPRIANRIYRRIRDFANYKGKNSIKLEETKQAFKNMKLDSLGLNDVDINYLKTLIIRFHGGPVGLQSLANAIGEDAINLEDLYEPYLLKLGLIDRTLKGRIALPKAYKHIKIIK